MFGASLQRLRQRQQVSGGRSLCDLDCDDFQAAFGHRAGLVEGNHVEAPRRFQRVGSSDDHTHAGSPAAPGQEGGGCCQTEGARACNDQDGNGRADRLAGRSRQEPAHQRGYSHDDHGGHEDPRDPVGQALDRCLARQGLGHQPHDLGKGAVRADPPGLHHERAVGIEGSAGHAVTGADLGRHGLSCHDRGVHGGVSVGHNTVGGDPLAGPDQEPHADGQLGGRDVAPVGEPHVTGAQFHECADGVTCPASGARLQVAPQQDDRHDDRGRVEVHVPVEAADGDDRRPSPGDQ